MQDKQVIYIQIAQQIMSVEVIIYLYALIRKVLHSLMNHHIIFLSCRNKEKTYRDLVCGEI